MESPSLRARERTRVGVYSPDWASKPRRAREFQPPWAPALRPASVRTIRTLSARAFHRLWVRESQTPWAVALRPPGARALQPLWVREFLRRVAERVRPQAPRRTMTGSTRLRKRRRTRSRIQVCQYRLREKKRFARRGEEAGVGRRW